VVVVGGGVCGGGGGLLGGGGGGGVLGCIVWGVFGGWGVGGVGCWLGHPSPKANCPDGGGRPFRKK